MTCNEKEMQMSYGHFDILEVASKEKRTARPDAGLLPLSPNSEPQTLECE
jgi:hypothetical protein